MSKFHIGDKVKCTDNFFKYPCKNKIGRIVDFDDYRDDVVAVEFEDYVHGHSFRGRGRAGHCLSLPENLLINVDIKSNMPLHNNCIKARPEFTDKEILDSLYTCSCHECTAECLLKGHDDCMSYLPPLAIELVQSQQRKIDTIEKENEKLRLTVKDICDAISSLFFTDDIKSYKEFAEKVVVALVDNGSEEFIRWVNNDSKINVILKELTKAIKVATDVAMTEQQEEGER